MDTGRALEVGLNAGRPADGAVSRLYGKKYVGVIRSAFLVDERGRIAEAWPKISPKDTAKKLHAALAG